MKGHWKPAQERVGACRSGTSSDWAGGQGWFEREGEGRDKPNLAGHGGEEGCYEEKECVGRSPQMRGDMESSARRLRPPGEQRLCCLAPGGW